MKCDAKSASSARTLLNIAAVFQQPVERPRWGAWLAGDWVKKAVFDDFCAICQRIHSLFCYRKRSI
jgi:hypothetical protein